MAGNTNMATKTNMAVPIWRLQYGGIQRVKTLLRSDKINKLSKHVKNVIARAFISDT